MALMKGEGPQAMICRTFFAKRQRDASAAFRRGLRARIEGKGCIERLTRLNPAVCLLKLHGPLMPVVGGEPASALDHDC